jgi:hypothetical protein
VNCVVNNFKYAINENNMLRKSSVMKHVGRGRFLGQKTKENGSKTPIKRWGGATRAASQARRRFMGVFTALDIDALVGPSGMAKPPDVSHSKIV